MDDTRLREAASEALHLKLEIEAGGNPSLLKREFFRKLEEHEQGREIVNLILSIESTFGIGALETTVNNFYGGNFANLNLGNQFGSVHAAINSIPPDQPKAAEIMYALRKLAEGICESSELNDGQKQEALESIEVIADQAKLPHDKRKNGVFRAAIGHLPTVLSSSAAVIKIWEFAHPVLTGFFNSN